MYINLIKTLFVKVGGALCSFTFTWVIAQSLSIDDAGLFFLALTLTAIINTISFEGVENPIVKFFAKNRTLHGYKIYHWVTKRVIKNILLLIVFFCTVCFIINAYIDNVIFPMYLIFLAIPASVCFINSFVYQGFARPFPATCVQVIIPYFFASLIIMVFNVSELVDTFYVYLICLVITSVVSTYSVNSFLSSYKDESKESLKSSKNDILKESRDLFIVSLVLLIGQWGGQLAAFLILNTRDVALYGVAFRVSLLFNMLLLTANFYVSSRFARLFHLKEYSKIRKLNYGVMKLLTVVSLPCFLLVYIFKFEILGFFGEEYKFAYVVLFILCFGQLINVISGPVNYILIMSGNSKELKRITIVSNLFVLLFLPVSSLVFGVEGCALIVTLGIILQNLLSWWSVIKNVPREVYVK